MLWGQPLQWLRCADSLSLFSAAISNVCDTVLSAAPTAADLSHQTGWGNTGVGVTLLLMPLLFKSFSMVLGPQLAWRATFLVPAGLQLIAGMMVLVFADDNPEGRLPQLNK